MVREIILRTEAASRRGDRSEEVAISGDSQYTVAGQRTVSIKGRITDDSHFIGGDNQLTVSRGGITEDS